MQDGDVLPLATKLSVQRDEPAEVVESLSRPVRLVGVCLVGV